MDILIVGANTITGRHLIKYILNSGCHTVYAFMLNPVYQTYFHPLGVKSKNIDLTQKQAILSKELTGINAMVFTGSTAIGEKQPIEEVDELIRLIEAARHAGIKRFIHMSNLESRKHWSSLPPIFLPSLIKDHYIKQWLKFVPVDYTIIQTGTLNDHKGTGLIQLVDQNIATKGEISREDVAKVIFSSLENPSTYRKTLNVISGKVPIEEVLASLK